MSIPAKIGDHPDKVEFYPQDIYPTPPDGCFLVSEADYWEYLENQGRYRFVDGVLTPYAPPVDLLDYAKGKQSAVLTAGAEINVAPAGSAPKPVLCDGLNSTRADLALLVLNAQANPTDTETWIDNEGVTTVLTSDEVIRLATFSGRWMSNTYGIMAKVSAGLAAVPPTITSTADVDALFAAAAGQ